MELVQLAGVYFLGTEEYNFSNSMITTVILKEKIDNDQLVSSYKKLIIDNPLLQTKIVECPGHSRFYWGRFSSEELKGRLDFEEGQLVQMIDRETLLSQYYPTNQRLPFCLSIVDENTVVVSMNHILANGRGLVFWIQKWLQYYRGENSADQEQLGKKSIWQTSLHMLNKLGAFLWLPVFLTDFILKSGKNATRDTVDLSYGKKPRPSNDYVAKAYTIQPEDTQEILRRCKLKELTLTEYLCEVLARALLQYDQRKNRVLLSIPMDLQSLVPYSPKQTPGNLIASLPVQFFRGKEIEKQVKTVFKWFKRGIPFSLSSTMAITYTYVKAKNKCLSLCKKTIPERTILGDFSLTYSNLGVISYPVMEKTVDSIYFCFKSQSILLVSSSISGKLCMEISFSRDLYNAEEVFNLFDKVLTVEYLLNPKQEFKEEI
ncbi:NRPS condensation-like uncharacterized protein [Sporomusaceae bacterium BoRhaA]|uniref:hypothetical protein n=1 Tax=Pelorhabdus rhamnosifermentans TaxID=2772457 RepID=UPI001C060350|nr:hypothetical protein [Pelorhabdus rhamnosifermentans]MBU2703325.1 NRPS condensation-like uncharacterized protein [Pelorhabdus rhamnosifermentans]